VFQVTFGVRALNHCTEICGTGILQVLFDRHLDSGDIAVQSGESLGIQFEQIAVNEFRPGSGSRYRDVTAVRAGPINRLVNLVALKTGTDRNHIVRGLSAAAVLVVQDKRPVAQIDYPPAVFLDDTSMAGDVADMIDYDRPLFTRHDP